MKYTMPLSFNGNVFRMIENFLMQSNERLHKQKWKTRYTEKTDEVASNIWRREWNQSIVCREL